MYTICMFEPQYEDAQHDPNSRASMTQTQRFLASQMCRGRVRGHRRPRCRPPPPRFSSGCSGRWCPQKTQKTDARPERPGHRQG